MSGLRARFHKILSRLRSRLSYRQKVMFVILGFAIIPIAGLSFFIIWTSVHSYKDHFRQEAALQLEARITELDKFYYYNVQKINYIINNRFLKEIVAANRNDPLLGIVTNYQIVADLLGVLEADTLGTKISVYTNNEFTFFGPFVYQTQQLDESVRKDLEALRENEIVFRSDSESINIYSKLDSINSRYGILRISIPLHKITDLLVQNLPDKSFIAYIPHDGGPLVYATAKDLDSRKAMQVYEAFVERRGTADFLVTDTQSQVSRDRSVLFLSTDPLKRTTLTYSWISLLVLLLVLIAIALTIRMVSFSLTKKLAHLVEHVRLAHPLPGSPEAEPKNNEFTLIEQKFIELVQKIQQDYRQLSDYEVKKRLLEVEVLQANINPHFLYNTLSTIRWTYSDKKLAQVIDSLVKYYRIVLSKGNTTLRMAEEIQMNEEYIKIQRFAYNSDFQSEIVVEDSVQEYYTLKNILQPIVENAILHGINGRQHGGILRITAVEEQDRIVLTVADNGIGIDPDKLATLLDFEADAVNSGYGIKNVHHRIQTYFGPEYGVSIASQLDEGTRVTIVLPKLVHRP
ncbi:sensor histidine kinase [Paenibacillus koleovorans]|uniref:sensor histidine kinase n=1 Tax=Paenibacillus koleovorans TaxID=121608 RepID=UPI000FD8EC4A|nr:sensor histidine kinase [Paenibacillus koleovorans]